MKIFLKDVRMKKPKTSYEKDEEAEDGVAPVTTLTVEVEDMHPDEVMRLARYAAYSHLINVTFESPQKDLVDMASRNGGTANG